MVETRVLSGPSEELAGLVQEFRNALAELNRSAAACSPEQARAEAADYFRPGRTVIGLFRKGTLIGFSVVKAEDGIFWLDWIYVRPEDRGFQNASALFEAAEQVALAGGEDQLYVWVHPDNNRMLRFLKKKGYDTLNLIEVTKRKQRSTAEIRLFENVLRY